MGIINHVKIRAVLGEITEFLDEITLFSDEGVILSS
tara:strand:- start:1293 stop:1400 length:108 start_codon:yes stop_codon:yes gene_type:complete